MAWDAMALEVIQYPLLHNHNFINRNHISFSSSSPSPLSSLRSVSLLDPPPLSIYISLPAYSS